jgi:hypothetical protein
MNDNIDQFRAIYRAERDASRRPASDFDAAARRLAGTNPSPEQWARAARNVNIGDYEEAQFAAAGHPPEVPWHTLPQRMIW